MYLINLIFLFLKQKYYITLNTPIKGEAEIKITLCPV